MKNEVYIGDGLYASDDGFMITLRTPREGGDHYVCLENGVLQEFIQFVEQSRSLKITINRIEPHTSETP